MYAASLDAGGSVRHTVAPRRHAWLQVARGSVTLNGRELASGDGVAVSDEPVIELTGRETSDVVLFDLA